MHSDQHMPEPNIYRTASPSWRFWYKGGLYQEFKGEFKAKRKLNFGGHFYMTADDPLRKGSKRGQIALRFYNKEEGGMLISEALAVPGVTANSAVSTWIRASGHTEIPRRTRRIQFVVSCEGYQSGDGSFLADDFFLEEAVEE